MEPCFFAIFVIARFRMESSRWVERKIASAAGSTKSFHLCHNGSSSLRQILPTGRLPVMLMLA
jgi:hypothetical protein